MGSHSEKIKLKIKEKKVVMYSKTYCPFCHMAKAALDKAGATYDVIELDKMSDGAAYQDALFKITRSRTVPQVFVGGKYIGGGSETKALQDQGKLAAMVN